MRDRRWPRLAALVLSAMALAMPAAVEAAPPSHCDRCFALVRANDMVVRHCNLAANFKTATDSYLLVFAYSIIRCALSANVDSLVMEDNIRLGFISLSRGCNTIVKVDIYSPSGGRMTPVDFPFNMVVTS